MKLIRIAFLGSLAATACAAQNEPISAISIQQKIDRASAKSVVNELAAGDESGWDFVMGKVATGSADWLDVARRLSAGTDAGTSEALQIAVATALPKNPGGVLRLAGTQSFLSIDHICAAPFIEPQPSDMDRYLSEAKTALVTLNDPGVESAREKCLAEINSVKVQ